MFASQVETGHTPWVAIGVALGVLCSGAQAQSRSVVVNGVRQSDVQVAQWARLQCREIPDGNYWVNRHTGAWGYAGNPQVQGRVGDACHERGGTGGEANPDGTRGPFATMRRAEEEANRYRAQGYRAVAFHNGDGYYIRVSR